MLKYWDLKSIIISSVIRVRLLSGERHSKDRALRYNQIDISIDYSIIWPHLINLIYRDFLWRLMTKNWMN